VALIVGLTAGASAYAQDNANDPWLDLGEITLFGTGLETSVMDNPASVTVLDEGKIKKIVPRTVGDLLRTVPGLIVDDGNFDRVIIRGEGGNRVAIKIDGQALTDHTSYGTPILIDPTTIARIEIVRGSSSVVSGSRAIGGVINIITKRGGDKPFGGSFSAGYFSATKGYRTSLTLNGKQGGFDYRLTLGKSDRKDRETPTGSLVPSDIQDQNISAHLGYEFGNHYLAFKFQDYDLSANVYTGAPNMSIKLPKRDLTKGGLYYEGTDLTPWMSKLTASMFYQTVDRDFTVRIVPFAPFFISSSSQDQQITSGFNVDAVLEFAEGHRTRIGLEYENDFLDANKTSIRAFGPPTTTITHDKARIKTFSIYAQHEADLSKSLTAFLGLRYYSVKSDLEFGSRAVIPPFGPPPPVTFSPPTSSTDSRLLGSAGLVWSPNDNLALRFNLSQGYNHPSLVQKFITTTAGGTTIHGNPNLKPENSITAEIGARFDAGATVVDATLFYTEAKDYLTTETIAAGLPNAGDDTWVNVNRAKTFGLEVYAEHSFEGSNLTPYVSATWMRRKFIRTTGSTYNSGTPEIFGKIGVRYDWEMKNGIFGSLDAYVQGEGEVYSGATKLSSGYATFNIAAEAEINKNLHLTASFNNLFDKSYDPRSGIPGAERNVNLNLTWKF